MKLVNIYLFRFALVKCLNGEMLNTFVLKIELYYILYNLVWHQLSDCQQVVGLASLISSSLF